MADVETVDATGLSCPQPALMTKQTIDRQKSGLVEVLVDNSTSRDNVARIARSAGWSVTVEERAGGFRLVLEK
jgi:tRNA 2-thiouridine synthesizing protein A